MHVDGVALNPILGNRAVVLNSMMYLVEQDPKIAGMYAAEKRRL